MITFNYKTLIRAANNKPKRVFNILKYLSNINKGLSTEVIKYINSVTTKNSYILNPVELLQDTASSEGHKLSYIYLCSLRNYKDYLAYKDSSLSLDLIELKNESLSKLKTNPLLTIELNTIKFKYE